MREIRMPSLSAARAASLCLMAAALAGLAWWGWALMEPLPQAATPAARAGCRQAARNRPPRGWRPAPRGWM